MILYIRQHSLFSPYFSIFFCEILNPMKKYVKQGSFLLNTKPVNETSSIGEQDKSPPGQNLGQKTNDKNPPNDNEK